MHRAHPQRVVRELLLFVLNPNTIACKLSFCLIMLFKLETKFDVCILIDKKKTHADNNREKKDQTTVRATNWCTCLVTGYQIMIWISDSKRYSHGLTKEGIHFFQS